MDGVFRHAQLEIIGVDRCHPGTATKRRSLGLAMSTSRSERIAEICHDRKFTADDAFLFTVAQAPAAQSDHSLRV